MNWDAIGAIGTLGGGVAVLLTLVYLAIQVQNSRAVQLSGLADITAQWLRYGAYVQAFFDVAERYLRLTDEIDLDGQEDVLASIVRARIGIPGMAEWWRRNVGDYDPRFVDWVEEIRASA